MQNHDENLIKSSITSIQVIELDDDALESVAGGQNVICENIACDLDADDAVILNDVNIGDNVIVVVVTDP